MAKRKIIPIVVVLIVAFIAGQFNAFGSLAKLTGKIVVTVKATIKRISRILVVKEKDTEEVVEIKAQKAKTVSTPAKVEENAPIPEQLMNSMREKRLENDDWEDGTLLYNFPDDTNDDFYQEPEYDDVDVEPSDDWDSLLESLTIEIFSDEGYSEYLDANDEDGIESLFSSDELSGLELWLNIDKKTSEEIEDSIWELPELFDYIPNSD
ncbi:TPA: hypothetical protein EYP66_05935 [Candidatus Poribacteria bacterium]|nr:hypothetical protein [Candidatus Poribacteria bacterium]